MFPPLWFLVVVWLSFFCLAPFLSSPVHSSPIIYTHNLADCSDSGQDMGVINGWDYDHPNNILAPMVDELPSVARAGSTWRDYKAWSTSPAILRHASHC